MALASVGLCYVLLMAFGTQNFTLVFLNNILVMAVAVSGCDCGLYQSQTTATTI